MSCGSGVTALVALGVALMIKIVRGHRSGLIALGIVAIFIASVIPDVRDRSGFAALGVITSGVTNVIVNVKCISCEIAGFYVTIGIALVVEYVLRMLPFSNENHIALYYHIVEVPFDVTVHPSNYLVSGAFGNDRCYRVAAFFKFLGFNHYARLGLERDHRSAKASREAKCRQSETQGDEQYSEKSLFHNSSFR